MLSILAWALAGFLFLAILLVAASIAARRSKRRVEWAPVLDREVARWSAKSCQELVSELNGVRHYEIEHESKRYNVEVEVLENTPDYLNIAVAVDDGRLPASIVPLTKNFLRRKEP